MNQPTDVKRRRHVPFKHTPDLTRIRKRRHHTYRFIPAFTMRNPWLHGINSYADSYFGPDVTAEVYDVDKRDNSTVAVEGIGDPADWDKESIRLWQAFVAQARTYVVQ